MLGTSFVFMLVILFSGLAVDCKRKRKNKDIEYFIQILYTFILTMYANPAKQNRSTSNLSRCSYILIMATT